MMEVVRPLSPPRTQLSPVPGPLAIASTTTGMMPLKYEKPIYSSPPPVSQNTPENNNCRLIEYRGAKVAAFTVDGRELICLPQAFELFLKHLVGGLHTVYTKLKRLDITPIVCNVEQVRILRGLGAIQPGVNRCKLISPKEFDVLYDDCTNSSARPGRPPKRSSSLTATPETLEKLKKSRLDHPDFAAYSPNKFLDSKKSPFFGNGYHYPPQIASMPFLPMAHPMMSMMATHLGFRPDGSIIREPMHHPEVALASPRTREERPEDLRTEDNNNKPSDKPLNLEVEKRHRTLENIFPPQRPMSNGQYDLMNRSGDLTSGNEDLGDLSDDDRDDDDDLDSLSHHTSTGTHGEPTEKMAEQTLASAYSAQILNTANSGISSVETLLMNIQGLLKVASENARHRETQTSHEKAELTKELFKEKETREKLEKDLALEKRNGAILQKRLKKEKKVRRKLQEQLETTGTRPAIPAEEVERRSSPDNLRIQVSSPSQDSDSERNGHNSDTERRVDSHTSGIQNLMESFLASSQKSCNPPNGYLHPPVTPVIKQTESV